MNDILMIGKVEANRLTLNLETIDLVQFHHKLSQEVQVGTQHTVDFICRHAAVAYSCDEKFCG